MNRTGARRKLALATLPIIFLMIFLSLTAGTGAAVLHGSSSWLESVASPPSQSNPGNYWYVGALSNDNEFASNQGIRTEIQVTNQPNVTSFLAFWVSETMSNDLWGQVGYYIFHDSSPVAFYQVWNLTTRSEIDSDAAPVSLGNHLFSMSLAKGTTFQFSVDSKSLGRYDMRTNTSSSADPLYALSEEGYCSTPFSFEPVSFTSAMQVLQAGHWLSVTSAQSYGNAWGIVGNAQDQFAVGGNHSSLQEGTSLW